MSLPVIWLVFACVLVVAELVTGTFYLLMVALGFAAGGLSAGLGAGSALQFFLAAVVSIIGVLLVRRIRKKRGLPRDAQRNRDVILDIGETVEVGRWHDGHARVPYRGADWDAAPETPADATPGQFVIRAVHGSTLILAKKSAPSKE